MTSVDMGWLEIERARYEMLLDPLTGLPRWGLLLDRTAVALARARRSGTTVAIFVIEDP
jgi:GGDEF domain-containing protein